MKKIVPFQKEIAFQNHVAEITSISLEHTLKVEKENVCGEFIISGNYKMSDTSVTTENFNFTLPFDISLANHYLLDKVVVDVDDFYYEIINNNTLVVNIEVLIDHLEEKPLPIVEIENIDEKIEEEELNVQQEPENRQVSETRQELESRQGIDRQGIDRQGLEERQELDEPELESRQELENRQGIDGQELEERQGIDRQGILEEEEKTLPERCVEIEEVPVKDSNLEETQNPVIVKEKVVPVNEEVQTNLFEQFSKESENYATYKIFIVREGDSVLTICDKYNVSEEILSKYNDLKELKIGDKIIIPTNYVRN